MKGGNMRGIRAGILSAVFFLALFFGLRWNLIVCVLLALGMFEAVYLLGAPKRRPVPPSAGMREDPGARLKEAREDLEAISRSMEQIEDREIKEGSMRLHRMAAGILAYLEKHPDRIDMARRFIDYYQDTASSLLARYVELQNSGLDTPEIQKLKEDVKKATAALNKAFEQQFARIMSSEILDMDVEIRTIESMMKMEENS